MRSRCCDKNWARTLQPSAEYNTNDRRVPQGGAACGRALSLRHRGLDGTGLAGSASKCKTPRLQVFPDAAEFPSLGRALAIKLNMPS